MEASSSSGSSGYGPRRFQRLCFDGEEQSYELWEEKFLGYLRTLDLKRTITSESLTSEAGEDEVEEDRQKNEKAYAELIQFLDDKSLSLIIRDAADNGREALKILRNEYASHSKPKIVSLYTQLTMIEMAENESVTSYIIIAEKIITALQRAKEKLSDSLLIAMLLKGLPEEFKPFSIYVNTSAEDMSLGQFKVALKQFEETEKLGQKGEKPPRTRSV